MDEPRTILRFLTRSEGRIRLLLALEPGPLERAELASSTSLPRSTRYRLLDEFRRHRLLAVEGDRLVLAPQGMALARRLGETVDSIASMQRLQRRARELSPGSAALSAGTVTLSVPEDPSAPIRRVLDLLSDAT